MKNKFVLITVILWVNTFAVLAQNNKSDITNNQSDSLTKNKPTLLAPAVSIAKSNQTDTLIKNKPALFTPVAIPVVPAKKSKARTSAITKHAIPAPDTNASSLAKSIIPSLSPTDSTKTNITPRKVHISMLDARPFPLPEPNPHNILFYHRYWRDIALDDKQNKAFSTHHATLITMLLDALKKGKITAYNPEADNTDNPTGDAFTRITSYNRLMSQLSDTAYVDKFDKDGNKIGSVATANPFTPDKIIGYRIKEDMYYDKILGKVVTRIVGVAPLLKLTLSSGELIGIQPLCWLKFKDLRKVLVTIDVSDPAKRIGDSMDDVFLQRKFYGKIIQESNMQGLRIKDYKTDPAEQELEAKRIETKILNYKTGSWGYTLSAENAEPIPTNNIAARKPKKITNIVTAQH